MLLIRLMFFEKIASFLLICSQELPLRVALKAVVVQVAAMLKTVTAYLKAYDQ